MFTTYKCFSEDNYNHLIQFKDLEIGDIFVINYDFNNPMIKIFCESSEPLYCAMNLINRQAVHIVADKPVSVFAGQLNLPVSYYKSYRKD